MRLARLWVLLVGLMMGVTAARADDAAAKKELAPTGKLRVAIAVGPAPSGIYVLKDTAPGTYRGVTIDLSKKLAEKLGVPVEYVPYNGSGEIQASASSGVWDVTFMPVDEERRKFVDFGSSYHLLQSTYLVAPNSTIKTIAEANVAERLHRRRRCASARWPRRRCRARCASPAATHGRKRGK